MTLATDKHVSTKVKKV